MTGYDSCNRNVHKWGILSASVKILIADDHQLFQDALVHFIERSKADIQVTLAKDFFQAMDILGKDQSQDLVILDLKMPGMDGVKGFKKIKDKYPKIPVALMSGLAEAKDVRAARDMGAVAYFPKTMSGQSLMQAIQSVLDGIKFFPLQENTNKIMPSFYSDKNKYEESSDIYLTPREIEVLGYLSAGASNKEIAHALKIQVVTVKLHVRGVCRKLDVRNRTQAALKAQSMGVII